MLFSALGAVAMQCIASLNGQDVGPGNMLKGTSPGPGICQRSLVCLFLLSFHFLSIFGEGNEGVVGFALCRLLRLAGRCTPLHLLTLHELYSLVDTFATLDAME